MSALRQVPFGSEPQGRRQGGEWFGLAHHPEKFEGQSRTTGLLDKKDRQLSHNIARFLSCSSTRKRYLYENHIDNSHDSGEFCRTVKSISAI